MSRQVPYASLTSLHRDIQSHHPRISDSTPIMNDQYPSTPPDPIPPNPSDPSHDRHKSRIPTGLAPEPLNILILGASYAGLACAHHFLDHTLSQLRISTAAPAYRLVVVSPSTHIYWNIAAPRALVSPTLIKQEDLFVPIEEGFHRHRGCGVVFVQGEATGLDLGQRVARIEVIGREGAKRASLVVGKRGSRNLHVDGGARAKVQMIPYHALIMATGSVSRSELLGLHGTHLNTIGSLNAFHARVDGSRSIVVAGGGPSGVEVAGQLATYLNYSGTWPFRRKVRDPKRIILITGGERCLPALKPAVGRKAEKLLKRLGVEVQHGVRALAAQQDFDKSGQTRVSLNDNTSITADLYVDCTGVEPNSQYAPPELRDEGGYIQTNRTSLRVDHPNAGPRIYAIGDVAAYSQNYIRDVYAAVPVVMHNMLNDLLAYEYQLASPYGGNQDKIDDLVDEAFQQRGLDSQICPITRFGGVGMLMGYSVPRILCHLLKGKDYRVKRARRVVEDGGNPYAVRGKYE